MRVELDEGDVFLQVLRDVTRGQLHHLGLDMDRAEEKSSEDEHRESEEKYIVEQDLVTIDSKTEDSN